jgi:hypothetical protein
MADDIIHPPKRYPIRFVIAGVAVVLLGTAITVLQLFGGSNAVRIDYSKLTQPSSSERAAIDEAVASQAGLENVKAGTETTLVIDQFDGETATGSVTFSDRSAPKAYTAHKRDGSWQIISYKDR